MAEEYLTVSQVRDTFGFSRGTLIGWERQGKLKPQRTVGGHRRYSRKDIEAVLNGTEIPNVPAVTVNYEDLGTSGLTRWGQIVDNEQLPELRGAAGVQMFREMRTNDPVISAVFFAIESTLKQAKRRIKPASDKAPDIECADFVASCFEDMSFTFDDTMDFVLGSMLEQGASIVYPSYKRRLGTYPPRYTADPATSKYTDGRIGWRKWSPRPIDTLCPGNEWEVKDGRVAGCNQLDESGKKVFLPIESILLFRTTAGTNNSPTGRPIHRSMYIPYYYTKNYLEIEGIGVERDLNGVPVIYAGDGCTESDISYLRSIGVNLRNDEQMCVVIPYPKLGLAGDGRGVLVELLSSSNMRSHDIGAIIERFDKRKAMSVLAQFIMLGMDRTGSYALSSDQADLFNMATGSILNKVTDVINRIAIPRLLRYNVFPEITGQPEMLMSDVGVTNLKQLGAFINTMVGRNVITVDDELEQHMRQIGRLPVMPPEIIGERQRKAEIAEKQSRMLMQAQADAAAKPDPNDETTDMPS